MCKFYKKKENYDIAVKFYNEISGENWNGIVTPASNLIYINREQCALLTQKLLQHYNENCHGDHKIITLDDGGVTLAHWVEAILECVDDNQDQNLSQDEFHNLFSRFHYLGVLLKYDQDKQDLIKNRSMEDLIVAIQTQGTFSIETQGDNLKGLFLRYDKNGNGYLEKSELKEFVLEYLNVCNRKIHGEEKAKVMMEAGGDMAAKWYVDVFMKEGDKNHDGRLSYEEMVGIFKNIQVVSLKILQKIAKMVLK